MIDEIYLFISHRIQPTDTTAWTPSKNSQPLPFLWQPTRTQRPETLPRRPSESTASPPACLTPTFTTRWALVPTAYTTTASVSCWAWAAAPSSCANVSSRGDRWAIPAPSRTHSATAVSAATASRMDMCSSTKLAKPLRRLHPTTRSRPPKTRTWPDRYRNECRHTFNVRIVRAFERTLKVSHLCFMHHSWTNPSVASLERQFRHLKLIFLYILKSNVFFRSHVLCGRLASLKKKNEGKKNPWTSFHNMTIRSHNRHWLSRWADLICFTQPGIRYSDAGKTRGLYSFIF